MEKKEGKSNIKYMPLGRYVIVGVKSELEKDISARSSGLILSSDLSDSDKIRFGGTSKSADVANKTGEEQETYELLAVSAECIYCNVGDKVLFRPGCQPTAIKVGDKYYFQLQEYEVLGLML